MLIQRFSPDKKWHVDNIVKILIQAGQHVKDEVCRSFVVLVTNAPSLQPYTVRALYKALKDNVRFGRVSLITTACWCMGEYGEYLLNGEQQLEDEESLVVSEKEIVDLLESVLKQVGSDVSSEEYALTALMKLTAKLRSEMPRIKALLEQYKEDVVLELQQRCCEYIKILEYDQLYPQLLEKMPALDEKKYTESIGVDVQLPPENGTTENGSSAATPVQVKTCSFVVAAARGF